MKYQNTWQSVKPKQDRTEVYWAMAYMVIGAVFFIASLAVMN